MRIHFIAIGGSAMHNLALALHDQGHHITGSDDEIYEPSKSRLGKAGLLPDAFGWYTEKIEPSLDAIILGMHARPDNPELLHAQKLGLKIYSYPEFVANQSKNKKRIVIAGSHGKTTTTSIILHALSQSGIEYDYLVGAQLKGFDRMVQLSDAEIIILEGDEYLSSPIDRRPKMMHYDPDIAVITGVAWDHINVFPTMDDYVDQFKIFVENMRSGSKLFWYKNDAHLAKILAENRINCDSTEYTQVDINAQNDIVSNAVTYPLNLIGNHNLQNIRAAELVCNELGVESPVFFKSLSTFDGANKRLEILRKTNKPAGNVYLDFAHAPSKVKATTDAMKDWFSDSKLVAVFELHTFSSLNKDFIPQYENALENADEAVVFYSSHALEMKMMPPLDEDFVQEAFNHKALKVITTKDDLAEYLQTKVDLDFCNLLLMSSGTFDGMDLSRYR